MSLFVPKEGEVSTIALSSHDPIKGTPWEKVAHLLPPNATVPELLKAANLNWGLLHLPIENTIPKEYAQAAGIKGLDGEPIDRAVRLPVEKHFTLRRADTLEVLSPYMGNRYKPIKNQYAFEVFDQFVKAGEMTMESAGCLHNGEHVFGLAKIGKNFTLADGESIEGYFLLIQSHAYGHSLKAMFTPIRYPSGNTFVTKLSGVNGGYYAMPHSRVFDNARIEEIKDVVSKAEKQLKDFEATARFLAGTNIEEKDGVFYLAQFFDTGLIKTRKADKKPMPQSYQELFAAGDANRRIKNVASTVLTCPGADLPSCKDTAWGCLQGVFHALDHQNGHNTNTRLESSWLGKDAGIKVKALDMSVVMATKASVENGDGSK